MATKTKTPARKSAPAHKPAKRVAHKAPAVKATAAKPVVDKSKKPTAPVKAKHEHEVKAAPSSHKTAPSVKPVPAGAHPAATPARRVQPTESVSLIDGHKPKAKADGAVKPKSAILPPISKIK